MTASPGGTFELDWTFTNLANSYGVNPEVAVPTGWTVAAGTANNPTVNGGWNTVWDAADGVSWNTSYSTSGEFAGSPDGYSISYGGTPWDKNRNSAFDDASATNPGDRDRTAEKMGTDARITVPAGTTPGTYTVMVLGIGHVASGGRAHIEQAITVTVSSGISQAITVGTPAPSSAPYNSQFTVAATASSGLPVTYSSGSTSICTNSGPTFTMVSGTGTCIVQYDQAGGSGYAAAPRVTSNTTATKINQSTVSVTAPANATYGQLGLSATASGGSGTGTYSYSAGSSTACTVNASSGALTITSGTGSCSITATRATDSNYNVSAASAAATIAVNKAPLAVTAAAKSKTYGGADPALTYSATGFVNGDTTAVMTGSLTRVAGENVGNYPINQGTIAASNYTITYTGANLAINAAPLAVTAAAKNKTYGGTDPALTYSATGFVNGDTNAIMTGALTRVAGENVGNYAINQGTVAATSNYTIAYSAANLAINAAPLAVTAAAKNKTYGGTDPALTYTATGFVNGDTNAIMTGALTRVAGENVGNYAINQGTVAATSNYTIAYSAANLTINAAPLAVTAAAKNKTYGGTDPTLTYTATGFVNGDTNAIMTGALARLAGENVGNYAINQGTLAATSNYTITYTGANLTISAAPLTVTAAAKGKVYGAVDPALTYTATGFANGDTNAIMSGSLTRVAGENVGNYAINQGTVAATSNYTIAYTGADLTISTAPLTITADAKVKAYGAVDPALTYTATGFANGDTNAIMSGSLTRAAGENVGNYAINQGTVAANSNYTITYNGANLTIASTVLTVSADAKNKTYGVTDPALTYTVSGFVNGDTTAIMTGGLTRASGENAGNYAINQGTLAATSNYTVSYTGANLTIDPATLTVRANDQTKTQGSVNPPLTITYSGFVNGDTETSLTTQPTATTTATTASPAGPYPIIPDGGISSNYTFNYVVGTLTVTAAGNPTLNVTISGNGSVNSVPSGIACTGGTCSADFTSGQSVDLTAATSWNHDFTGWIGGACDGTTTNPCTVVVNSPTDVTATFTAKQLVKLPGGNYPSVQEAYAVAIEGENMQLRDLTFSENLDFNRTVQVKLNGGWNADYTSVSGNTTIDGTVTISSGGITISNLIIQ